MKIKSFITILPNDALGGAEYFLYNISKYLFKNYHAKGTVIFMKKAERNDWEPSKNIFHLDYGKTRKESRGIISTILRIRKYSKTKQNLILTSHAHLNGLVALLRLLKVIKCDYHVARESNVVYERHKGFKLKMVKLFHKFVYQKIDLIICQTEHMRSSLRQHSKYSSRWKLEVIPNPAPIQEIIVKAQSNISFKNQLKHPFVVAAGRLIELKGFDILIEAFKKLNDENLNLVILGDGPQKEELIKKVKHLNIENQIFFEGHVENPMPYFKNARLCVVSSILEGFPNVLLQMITLNNNVVSTLCAGGIEQIKGLYTCSPNNIHSLYLSMQECLINDNTNTREYFNRALKQRSLNSFVDKIIDYLENRLEL